MNTTNDIKKMINKSGTNRTSINKRSKKANTQTINIQQINTLNKGVECLFGGGGGGGGSGSGGHNIEQPPRFAEAIEEIQQNQKAYPVGMSYYEKDKINKYNELLIKHAKIKQQEKRYLEELKNKRMNSMDSNSANKLSKEDNNKSESSDELVNNSEEQKERLDRDSNENLFEDDGSFASFDNDKLFKMQTEILNSQDGNTKQRGKKRKTTEKDYFVKESEENPSSITSFEEDIDIEQIKEDLFCSQCKLCECAQVGDYDVNNPTETARLMEWMSSEYGKIDIYHLANIAYQHRHQEIELPLMDKGQTFVFWTEAMIVHHYRGDCGSKCPVRRITDVTNKMENLFDHIYSNQLFMKTDNEEPVINTRAIDCLLKVGKNLSDQIKEKYNIIQNEYGNSRPKEIMQKSINPEIVKFILSKRNQNNMSNQNTMSGKKTQSNGTYQPDTTMLFETTINEGRNKSTKMTLNPTSKTKKAFDPMSIYTDESSFNNVFY
jgi:hypothetical protein